MLSFCCSRSKSKQSESRKDQHYRDRKKRTKIDVAAFINEPLYRLVLADYLITIKIASNGWSIEYHQNYTWAQMIQYLLMKINQSVDITKENTLDGDMGIMYQTRYQGIIAQAIEKCLYPPQKKA